MFDFLELRNGKVLPIYETTLMLFLGAILVASPREALANTITTSDVLTINGTSYTLNEIGSEPQLQIGPVAIFTASPGANVISDGRTTPICVGGCNSLATPPTIFQLGEADSQGNQLTIGSGTTAPLPVISDTLTWFLQDIGSVQYGTQTVNCGTTGGGSQTCVIPLFAEQYGLDFTLTSDTEDPTGLPFDPTATLILESSSGNDLSQYFGNQININLQSVDVTTTVPEPTSLALLGIGLFGFATTRKLQRA
jgi:hypothetical protein